MPSDRPPGCRWTAATATTPSPFGCRCHDREPGAMTLRVLIVDDEPNARARLRDLLGTIVDVAVVGAIDNGQAAIDACRAGDIHLVLLDIRMPGLDGLDTARQLALLDRMPAVVFPT